jgi:DNA-binding GntR family transcriptional regulator
MNAPARGRTQRRRAVRREQLSDEVAARLRADIMTGTLRPGTFIRLDETAAALGVSITPVREALPTLRGEGMVQLEPHRGHVVVPLTRGDIADICWLQATIAKELAATTAERITDAQIEELEQLNDDWRPSVAATPVRSQRRVRVPPGVQPCDKAGSSWLVPVARRAVSAGTDLCQRCGVGCRGGGRPP